MASELKLVDAHHHFWDLENLKYEWLKGPNQLKLHLAGDLTPVRHTYTPEDLKADAKDQNLVKSVHLQAECSDEVGEAKWLQSLADKQGFPHAIIAHADLRSPDLEALLKTYKTLPNVRGVRQLANWNRDGKSGISDENLLIDENWVKGLHTLGKFGYSYDLQVWHHQLPASAKIVAGVPDVQFILNHTGMPDSRTPETYEEWKAGMKALAANPNVAAKISGLGMIDHEWTVDSIRPYVLGTIEIFGVDRCMFGSNFPIDKLLSDYNRLFNAFKEIVRDFSLQDKQKLFHDNACKFYRI